MLSLALSPSQSASFRLVAAVVSAVLLLASGAYATAQDSATAPPAGSDYAQLARACRALAPNAGTPPSASTPVTVQIVQPIVPVPATDGFVHLAYATQVTNLLRAEARIGAITPVDPLDGFKPTGTSAVVDGDGKDITGKVRLFDPSPLAPKPGETDFARMPGGSSGTTFFDVRYAHAADVPRLIAHRIAIESSGPGLPTAIDTPSDPLPVACDPPPVLEPPLVGSNWWNGNGCCAIVGPHRGATLPINGDIHAPESFAIDYAQLRDDNTCCTGPIHDLKSWPFYGAPILAAADGTVVGLENDMPEQVPAQPPVGVTVANAAGNHIIQSFANGRYFILYAHLKTGSIPKDIKVGTTIHAGRQIGELGNSGSTTAPHLHFQVMDRPYALNANGLPFVFTTQELQGTVKGPLNAADQAYELGKPIEVDRTTRGTQQFRMPAETQVFGYRLK